MITVTKTYKNLHLEAKDEAWRMRTNITGRKNLEKRNKIKNLKTNYNSQRVVRQTWILHRSQKSEVQETQSRE